MKQLSSISLPLIVLIVGYHFFCLFVKADEVPNSNRESDSVHAPEDMGSLNLPCHGNISTIEGTGNDDQRIRSELLSSDLATRRNAILSLGHAHVSHPIEILRCAFNDPAPEVRLAVLRTASESYSHAGTAFLIKLGLTDSDSIIQERAAHFISAYRHDSAISENLYGFALASSNSTVRMIAIRSLPGELLMNPLMLGIIEMNLSSRHSIGLMSPLNRLGMGLGVPSMGLGVSSMGLGVPGMGMAMGGMRAGMPGMGMGSGFNLFPFESASPNEPRRRQQSIVVDPIPLSRHQILASPVTVDRNVLELFGRSEERLAERLDRNFISSGVFNLTEDFEKAQQIIEQVKAREPQTREHYRLNYDFLSADPYLSKHSKDIHQLYPVDITDQQWTQIQESLRLFPEVAALEGDLDSVFRIVDHDRLDTPNMTETKRAIRKRVQRLLDEARRKEELQIEAEDGMNHRARLGLQLILNSERCIDGLQSGLNELEKEYFSEGSPESSGEFISHILTDYKMKFIDQHAQLNPASSEFMTTAPQVLRQRMLYSLGLRGNEADVAYPFLGSPDDPALAPAQVMARFLAGGASRLNRPQNSPEVRFQAYTVDFMVQLLQESRVRGYMNRDGTRALHPEHSFGMKLKNSMMQQIIAEHPELEEAYLGLFESPPQPSLYFQPAPEGESVLNVRTTDQFWLYLLEANDYIRR